MEKEWFWIKPESS